MLKPLVLLSVLLALGVDDCQSTDPLLLEYSDYYYDLYYGDYDDDKDYKAPGNICMHNCTDFILDLNLFLLVLVSFSVFVSSVFLYLYLFLC